LKMKFIIDLTVYIILNLTDEEKIKDVVLIQADFISELGFKTPLLATWSSIKVFRPKCR